MIFNIKVIHNGLSAPRDYDSAPQEFIDELTNGCGPKGWKVSKYINRFMIYLIGDLAKESCDIHDWMYEYGEDESDREKADDLFHENLKEAIVLNNSFFMLRHFQYKIAKLAFLSVRKGGEGPFNDKELRTV